MNLTTVARGIREISVVFLGATLLFLIQPIAGQRMLAGYGGSPSVWLATLLFFQAGLFLGYAWGFLVSRIRNIAGQTLCQMTLLCLTVVSAIPVDVRGEVWIPVSFQPIEVTLSLAAQLLLPVICLGSVSPLVQSWGARVAGRRPPYWLYAISNLASLIALVAYPFLIQPNLDLVVQQKLWTSAFLGFVSVYAWNAIVALFADQPIISKKPNNALSNSIEFDSAWDSLTPDAQEESSQHKSSKVAWLVLSFLPSILLMAVTNQITADVAAGPLFWTLPLAAYLATFTFAFSLKLHSPIYSLLAMAGLAGLVVCSIVSRFVDVTTTIVIACGSLFVVCLELHRLLAKTQPHREHLPAFYLWVSAGGLLGGLVSNLVAPLVFSNYFELELAVLASAAVVYFFARFPVQRNTPTAASQQDSHRVSRRSRIGKLVLNPIRVGILLTVLLLAGIGIYAKWPNINRGRGEQLLAQKRTFHGVFRVIDKQTPDGTLRIFGHGWTDHGSRLIDGPRAASPSGYYAAGSGAAFAFKELHSNKTNGLNVCILGLGAGSLLCWKQPDDRFIFVEIDPLVVQLQSEFFSELNDSKSIVFEVGDGRKYLEGSKERFDLIVLDAFSGDSVPAHLLTLEAMTVYQKRLELDGILAVNISNRYLDFYPVLKQLAAEFDLDMAEIACRPGNEAAADQKASNWVLLSRVPFSAGLKDKSTKYFYGLDEVEQELGTGWRDDFTPVLPLLK